MWGVLLFYDLTNLGTRWHILGSTTFRVVETLVKVLYLWIPWGTYEGVPTFRVGRTNYSGWGHGSAKRPEVQCKRLWNFIFFLMVGFWVPVGIQACPIVCQGYVPEKSGTNRTQNTHLKRVLWGLGDWQSYPYSVQCITIPPVDKQTCREYKSIVYTVYINFYTLYTHFYTVYLFVSNSVNMWETHVHSC